MIKINPLISDFKNICRRFHIVCFYFETCMITCSLLPVFNRTKTNKQHFTEQHNNLCFHSLHTSQTHTAVVQLLEENQSFRLTAGENT